MEGRDSTPYCITDVQGLRIASVAAIRASAYLRFLARSSRIRMQRVNSLESRL